MRSKLEMKRRHDEQEDQKDLGSMGAGNGSCNRISKPNFGGDSSCLN